VHTRKEFRGNPPGFNFLGFNVRQYDVGKHQEGKRKQGFKTLIKPQKESLKKHHREIKAILRLGQIIAGITERLNQVNNG
jgi:RNA-directed DNA polymerase